MKATKTFRAVRPGEIYPVTVREGDEIPSDLEQKAVELGAATRAAPRNKSAKPESNK